MMCLFGCKFTMFHKGLCKAAGKNIANSIGVFLGRIKYERLETLCYICGMLVHIEVCCEKLFTMTDCGRWNKGVVGYRTPSDGWGMSITMIGWQVWILSVQISLNLFQLFLFFSLDQSLYHINHACKVLHKS